MLLVASKNKVYFTRHARAKMQFYKLSESRVRHVLHSPKRIEEGIAPKTIAMMQPVSPRGLKMEKWNQEIWVMLQEVPAGKNIISAWRYPGVTKARSELTKEILRQEYDAYKHE
jgi:hypothetical protein